MFYPIFALFAWERISYWNLSSVGNKKSSHLHSRDKRPNSAFYMGADIWNRFSCLRWKCSDCWTISPAWRVYSYGLLGFTVLVIWQLGNHSHRTGKGWGSCLECHNPFQGLSRRSEWQREVYQACDSLCPTFFTFSLLRISHLFVFMPGSIFHGVPWVSSSYLLCSYSM